MSADDAAAIAFQALGFLASDPARLRDFLALTGIDPGSLRDTAGETRTQVAVLEHLLGDESMLLVFAAGAGLEPGDAGRALELLTHAGGR